jgi:polysaccharide biosynthesis/export protein
MVLRLLNRLLLFALLALVAGCASIPRAGPGETSISPTAADIAGFTLIDMTAAKVGDYRIVKAADQAGTAGIPSAPRIRLAPGDVLKIKISESKEGGLFAPLASGGTPFDGVRVDDRGTISLPYAGRVKVAGLDPPQVEDRIRSRLAGVTFEPQVFVDLITGRATSVLVSGEVRNPGRFSLLEGPLTLIDAINKAGGAVKPPHQVDVVIRRGSRVLRVPLDEVQDGNNRELQPGDEVILELNVKFFNAMGATTKQGQIEFPTANPSLLDALALVGGLNQNVASSTGVFVFRLLEPKAYRDASGNWQPSAVIFKFDMSKPETMFVAQAFAMKPQDTIYITNAPAVEWVRALLPIATALSVVRNGVALDYAIDVLANQNP